MNLVSQLIEFLNNLRVFHDYWSNRKSETPELFEYARGSSNSFQNSIDFLEKILIDNGIDPEDDFYKEQHSNEAVAIRIGAQLGIGKPSLNLRGVKYLKEKELKYKAKNQIDWMQDVSKEPWFKDIKDNLFHQKYKDIYWSYKNN